MAYPNTAEARAQVRRLWESAETIHLATYFSQESYNAFQEIGLKGYWMGYFAGRAAPLGSASSALVQATFFNFSPARVSRAIPDAWSFADPRTVLAARLKGVTAALRNIWSLDEHTEVEDSTLAGSSPTEAGGNSPLVPTGADLGRVSELVSQLVSLQGAEGRPLGAANAALLSGDNSIGQELLHGEPVATIWQGCTAFREYRGDGHIALLANAGVSGIEANVLACAWGLSDREMLQGSRGWSDEEWQSATEELMSSGWLTSRSELSPEGLRLREEIESETDRLSLRPYYLLGEDRWEELSTSLRALAAPVIASGIIPFNVPSRKATKA